MFKVRAALNVESELDRLGLCLLVHRCIWPYIELVSF